jgi:hypothetical protein
MEVALAVAVLVAIVALVVLRPLFAGAAVEQTADERRAALEAAKEAKYREIHDAELDYRTGKLSEEDYRMTDGELRSQAIAILREIDASAGEEERGERSDAPGSG